MLSKVASCSLCSRSIVSAERTFSSRWLSGVRLRSALLRASLAGFAGKGFYRFCFYPSLEAEFFVQGGARSARCGVAAEKPFRPHSLGISSPCGAPGAGSRTGFSRQILKLKLADIRWEFLSRIVRDPKAPADFASVLICKLGQKLVLAMEGRINKQMPARLNVVSYSSENIEMVYWHQSSRIFIYL
jgi:hypothetical protein